MSLNHAAHPPTRADSGRIARWALLGLAGLIVLAYTNVWRAPFVFDDEPAIALVSRTLASGEIGELFRGGSDPGATTSGRPLLTLSLAFNYLISAEDVGSYRFTNLTLHLATALLLYGTLRRLLQLPRVGFSVTAATFTALSASAVWSLHPAQTQVVSSIVQRAEALMALAYLGTLYAFLRSFEAPRSAYWQVVAVGTCAAGMAAKEVMVTAPLMMLLLDRTLVSGSFREALHRRAGAYAALAATWLVLALFVALTAGRGGTAGFDAGVAPGTYLLTQTHALAHYALLGVWPLAVVFDHGTTLVRHVGAALLPGAAILLLLVATSIGLARRRAWALGPAWWLVILAPSSSVVPIASQTIADHRVYLALAGPIALAVAGTARVLGARARAAGVLIAIPLTLLTFASNQRFASAEHLWTDTVAKRPANARAHHNLGLAVLQQDRLDDALTHFERARQLDPQQADTAFNLGLVRARLGRHEEALTAYQQALALQPDHLAAQRNLGTAFLALGRPAEAVRAFERAVRLAPRDAVAHLNLSTARLDAGAVPEALDAARQAIALEPGSADAYFQAGNALLALGDRAAAREQFERARSLAARDPRVLRNLGNLLIESGELAAALPLFAQLVQLTPDDVPVRRNLALLYLHLQRPGDAEPHLAALLQLTPDDPSLLEALRQVRARR